MLFIGLPALGQQPGAAKAADSVRYYSSVLSAMERRAYDSLSGSDPYRTIQQRKRYWEERAGVRYAGFTYYYGFVSTDYSGLNRRITPYGFAPMGGGIFRIGLGYSLRTYKGWIVDLGIFTTSFENTSGNGTETIGSIYDNYAQVSVGYSIVRRRKLSVYPYGGLSMQVASLYLSRPPRGDTIYNAIFGVAQGDQPLSATSTALGYQAGIGVDWVVIRRPQRWFGLVLFLKTGAEGKFGTERYKTQGGSFEPSIRNGGWGFMTGVKLI